MARAATTSDVFNAVAEHGRREILDALADGEVGVTDLVARLGQPQPTVSKHLAVLRAVDLVSCRLVGRQRLYRLNPAALTPMYHWLTRFEILWAERFDRFDDVLAELREEAPRHPATRNESPQRMSIHNEEKLP